MECYRQCIHHFKSWSLHVFAQNFNEGEINMGITNGRSDQARNYKEEREVSLSENWKKVSGFWILRYCGYLWFKFII